MGLDQHIIIGRYKILRLPGKCGVGEVHLAEDTRLKREVGLKMLHEAVRNEAARLRRLRAR